MDKRDEDLIEDYNLRGDPEALTMIFCRYKKPVLNYALRILGNRADAEDALSDVFLSIFGKKFQFDGRAKFSTWAFTVARNVCIDKIRKRKKFLPLLFRNERTQEMEVWDPPDAKALPGEDLGKKETARHVQSAIQKLPLEQKEAIVLREYHGLSYEEISGVLNCSLAKVKILIFRARGNLKIELSSFLEGDNRHG